VQATDLERVIRFTGAISSARAILGVRSEIGPYRRTRNLIRLSGLHARKLKAC
jgi:hypothetical protein